MSQLDLVKTDCFDLAMHTGVTYIFKMSVISECSGLPNDLTGYSARLLVYDGIETNEIVEIIGTITDAENGEVLFELSAEDTSDLDVGMYSYNIELTSSGLVVYRIAQGKFQIED